MDNNDDFLSQNQVKLLLLMQELWIEHALWTRNFIISTIMGLGDLEYVTQRLLRNPDDFAVVLRQFYGDEIAMEFEELFTHHLLIAADLLNAVMAGNQSDSAEIRSIWYENAEDLATFLSEVNPFWNKDTWQNMLFDHLEMIEEEVSLLLNEHYADSITQYDAIQNQAIEMAYEMAFGIFQQLGK